MTLIAVNPADGTELGRFAEASPADVEQALAAAQTAYGPWRARSVTERAALLGALAGALRDGKADLARQATLEMGKPIREAEAEVDKSASFCEHYAQHAERLLAPERIEAGGVENYVRYEPLGVLLAVMPWNFPNVQVFRFAPPALAAGNVAVLKHASNVPHCAQMIEDVFRSAGFPDGVFQTLLVGSGAVDGILGDPRVRGVALTGSDTAGSHVAAAAGRALKPSVMELGGSDPFIVLEDADVAAAAAAGCRGRNINAGQACIAAKRFIVADAVADAFEDALAAEVGRLAVGDPLDRGTDVGPLARPDLVDELRRQVDASVAAGAELVVGGFDWDGPGCYVRPMVLTGVTPEMPVFREETFGPVAAIMRVSGEEEAIAAANDSQFGLGASVWTQDLDRARRVADRVEAGMVFVNSIVFSDARLPFGGKKRSGYGRELGDYGIREFVDVKSVAVHTASPVTPPPAAAQAGAR
ncbi:MAG: succinate-semialdehyde dehydrogenase / glutarate-semialdehyde dehydrogenase [Solirubrobacteraceae bacterium]|nr:succinate-semialdehyde dehydrogenase / glutarate-semialdehyde dehydrogenase [Solirubrobacteraceae bacterium]